MVNDTYSPSRDTKGTRRMKRLLRYSLGGGRYRCFSGSMEAENAKYIIRASHGREVTRTLERKLVTRIKMSVTFSPRTDFEGNRCLVEPPLPKEIYGRRARASLGGLLILMKSEDH